MYPFPPPPPFWETTGGAIAIYLALLLVVLGTVGGMLLRSKRKAQPGDITIWCTAGVLLTIVFVSTESDVYAVRVVSHASLYLLWIAVVFGSWWSWLRLHDNDKAETVVSVVAMIAMGLLLILCLLPPGTGHPPEAYWRPQCRGNLHNIGLALHNYHDAVDSFPPQIAGRPSVSWRVNVLPYLDHENIYRDYDMASAWDSPGNVHIAGQSVPEYTCPSVPDGFRDRDGLRFTSYAVAVGLHTLWQGDRPTSFDFATDGSSHTLLVVEACGQQIIWTEPRDIDLATTPVGINLPGNAPGMSDGMFSSYHTGGTNILMADGAVRFISQNVDPTVLEALVTADGGEEVGEF